MNEVLMTFLDRQRLVVNLFSVIGYTSRGYFLELSLLQTSG